MTLPLILVGAAWPFAFVIVALIRALVEALALRGTTPEERPPILRAMRSKRVISLWNRS